MWALIKLQGKTMIKNPSSLMYVFMPLIMVSILSTVFPYASSTSYTNKISDIVTMNMVAVTMITFGTSLFEMRKSILMKRIGASSISKQSAMGAFFIFFSAIGLVTITWTMTLGTIFGASGAVKDPSGGQIIFDWSIINWGSYIWAVFWGIIVSLALGFLLMSISKNLEMFNMLAMLYMMLFMFMGGLFFPTQADWMRYIAYALPHSYVASAMKTATAGFNIFAFGGPIILPGVTPGTTIVYEIPEVVANAFLPMIYSGLAAGLSMKTFKWDA